MMLVLMRIHPLNLALRHPLKSQMAAATIGSLQQGGGSRQCRQASGIGRMLDMGGMPSASNDQSPIRAVNASKNSKLQAVAFDFEVLTRSLDAQQSQDGTNKNASSSSSSQKLGAVQPDLDQIQQVASLLKVNVDTSSNDNNSTQKIQEKTPNKLDHLPNSDVRAKYASKLKGGLAGLELAKSQIQDTLQRGDAAGHLAARKKAILETAASPNKWMALTGTGKLLSYLTHRSIQIALLPNPTRNLNDVDAQKLQTESMEQFQKQLKDVVVDAIVRNDDSTHKTLQKGVIKEFDIHPNRVLLVSDQDEYLKAARDLGMMTCRVRPLNARRGNITTHYSAPSIPEVQEVINEINGISFNAVLNR